LAGVAAWACNGDTTQPRPPFDLLKSGGAAPTWYFNNPLPTPLSVTAVDVSGPSVPGVVVPWAVAAGRATPAPHATTGDGAGTTRHSVTYVTGPGALPTSSPTQDASGPPFGTTFTTVGRYTYLCTQHPTLMTGSVTVVH